MAGILLLSVKADVVIFKLFFYVVWSQTCYNPANFTVTMIACDIEVYNQFTCNVSVQLGWNGGG